MSASRRRAPSLWFDLGAVTLVQAIATFSSLTLAATAPVVARDVGVPAEFIGFQIALVYGGASAISTLAGFLLRRWGPGRVSQISLVLCGAGAALMAIPSVAAIGLGALIMGFGYGMTNPSGAELLMKRTPGPAAEHGVLDQADRHPRRRHPRRDCRPARDRIDRLAGRPPDRRGVLSAAGNRAAALARRLGHRVRPGRADRFDRLLRHHHDLADARAAPGWGLPGSTTPLSSFRSPPSR